jgi:RHS repeat-associated protein
MTQFAACRSRYTGKERDAESGNDYFGARYYASSMGRFMTPDPSGLYYADPNNPQSFNLYAYAQNSPLIKIDPTGLDACAYDNGNGTATIYNAADGGAVDCPGDGFYITTTQQVTAVGFNQNGDLSLYGADGALYSPDGSPYDAQQTVQVGGDDDGDVSGLPVLYSGLQYVSSIFDDPDNARILAFAQAMSTDTKFVHCFQEALGKNSLSLGLDAAGFIPGEGLLAAGTQYAVATASSFNSGYHGDIYGRNAAMGGQLVSIVAGVNSLGPSAWGKAIPFVGFFINGIATAHDLSNTRKDYQECMSHP